MNASAARAILALALTGLTIGCSHGEKTAPPARADSTPALPGPGNTPKSVVASGTVPKHFWIDYEFEPKGRRDWVNVGKGKWEERWANGTVVKYVEVEPYSIGGYNGIVVQREKPIDQSQILLPYGGVGASLRFREFAGGRNWGYLADIAGVE